VRGLNYHAQFIAVPDRRHVRYVVQSGKSYKTDEMENGTYGSQSSDGTRVKCDTSSGCANL